MAAAIDTWRSQIGCGPVEVADEGHRYRHMGQFPITPPPETATSPSLLNSRPALPT